MQQPEERETLYHYTTGEKLMSILNSGSLRFTHIRFLNDGKEFHHAWDVVQNHIRVFSKKYRPRWIEANCNPDLYDLMVKEMQRRSAEEIFEYLISIDYEREPFVFSLSADGDSLGQWRAYGGEYAIGFDKKALENWMHVEPGNLLSKSLFRVTYAPIDVKEDAPDSNTFAVKVKSFFENSATSQVLPNGGIHMETIHDGYTNFFEGHGNMHAFLTYKHAAFRDEQEWRAVIRAPLRHESVNFHPSRYPRPYFDLKLGREALARGIKFIVGGPGSLHEINNTLLRIVNKNFDCNFEYVKSEVPYRSF